MTPALTTRDVTPIDAAPGKPSALTRMRRSIRHRLSLRGRVAMLAAGAVAGAVLMAAFAAYVTVRHELLTNLDRSLQTRATALIEELLYNDAQDQILSADPAMLAASGSRIGLLFSNGKVLGVAPLPVIDGRDLAVASGNDSHRLGTVVDPQSGARFRQITLQAIDRTATSPGVALVVAESLDTTDRTLRALGLAMWVTGCIGVLVAAALGYLVGWSGLRPVAELTQAAERVSATDRLDPIPVVGADETARLTMAFNAMLESVARSRERQRQLVGDAGHELRTPLTSIRTNLDLLAQADAPGSRHQLSGQDRQSLFDDIRAQMDELTSLLNDLTELSRDTPQHPSQHVMDLADVVEECVERVRRRAPSVHLDVDLQSHRVRGNEQLLVRAITNLLDNAAKYTGDGGTVTTRLADGRLTVTDNGPGISEQDLPHVFERFYRAAEARGRSGSGLGLAIVKHVADQHGGSVTAENHPGGGAVFTFVLPRLGRTPAEPESDPQNPLR